MSSPKKRPSTRLNERSLTAAVENDKIEDVRNLIRQGIPVGTLYTLNRTALHAAVCCNNDAMVKLLLHHKAQITDRDRQKNTPLHFAVERGNLKIIKRLLHAPLINGGPAEINVENSRQETPLHLAASKGHLYLIKYLIKRGAEVDAMKTLDETPLHLAAAAGHSKVIVELLNFKANVNARKRDGSTPLHCALLNMEKQVEVVNILLQFGARIDWSDQLKRTALHVAAQKSSPRLIRLLLDRGANVNLMSSEGLTPLHYAVQAGNREIIWMLLCAGADINLKTKGGDPVFFLRINNFWRRFSGNTALFDFLLECGADINAQNAKGYTFLHFNYLMIKIPDVIANYMDLFIDLNSLDVAGRTALELSAYPDKYRSHVLIQILAKMETDKKLTINHQNMEIISNMYQEYYDQCKDELSDLKKRKVYGKISFYDLLNKPMNDLVRYARNEELLRNFISVDYARLYTNYGIFLNLRMKKALMKKELIDKSLEVLTKLFTVKLRPKLPHFVGLEVLLFLNTLDLENLCIL